MDHFASMIMGVLHRFSDTIGWSGIFYIGGGDNGQVYGSPTLSASTLLPKPLTIGNSAILTVGTGVELSNSAPLTVHGTLINNGTFTASAPIYVNGTPTNNHILTAKGGVTINGDGNLTVGSGGTLSGGGVLDGEGQFLTTDLTGAQLNVPDDLVYNGLDRSEEIKTATTVTTTICDKPFIVTGGTLTVTDSGDHQIQSGNYADMTATTTVNSTNKTEVTISGVNEITQVYNGKPIQSTGTPTVTVNGKPVKVKNFVYSWDTPDGQPPINAGSYTLTVSVSEDDPDYMGSVDVPVEITKAAIRITAPSRTIQVGGTAPTLSAADCTITGLVGGDQLEAQPTVAYETVPDTSRTGSVVIKASGAAVPATGNYEDTITYVSGTLTIVPQTAGPSDRGASEPELSDAGRRRKRYADGDGNTVRRGQQERDLGLQ